MAFLFRKRNNKDRTVVPPATGNVYTSKRAPSTETSPAVHGIEGNGNAPRTPPSPNLDPDMWSQRRLNFLSPGPGPFPRYGTASNPVASKEGDVYIMGGLVDATTVKGDLWIIESSGSHLDCFQVATISEGPGPRVGHASLLVGNAFIVFGGDTKLDEDDELDETLYLLNTRTRQWSRTIPPGLRPAGRYGHSLNILGSKLYVFGGQKEGYFFNDILAFDLNELQNYKYNWEQLIQSSHQGGPAGRVPSARTNHTVVNFRDKLYLFGGTNGRQWFNDVWAYDHLRNIWTELGCVGMIPVPREGHAVALVDDVMYVFGGRTDEGVDLKDLSALRIETQRWYSIQNTGPAPSPRSGHSMTVIGKEIMVTAGEPSSGPIDAEELSMVYILDTSKIRYSDDRQYFDNPAGNHKSPGQVYERLVQDITSISGEAPLDPESRVKQESSIVSSETASKRDVTVTNPTLQPQPRHLTPQQITRKKLPITQQFQHLRSQRSQSPSSLTEAVTEAQSETTTGNSRIPSQELASKQEANIPQQQPTQKIKSAVSQLHPPLAVRVRSAVDLVRDSYLDTEIIPGFTKHVVWASNRNARQRRVRREELWKREHELGNGSYGRVWLESCTEGEETGSLRAVKEITKITTSTKIEYERELEALAKFSNEKYVHCFVQFFGWWESSRAIFISMEYVPDGDLQRLLTAPFPETITWEIVGQILEGLAFMHENGFTHRDLKPGNILVLQQSPSWWVKIADFGITKRAQESTALRTFVGTHGYLAPEVIGFVDVSDAQDPSYTSAVDIWALGEMTFRLITNQSTFSNTRALARYAAAQIPLPFVELDRVGASGEIKHFLEKAMAAHPSERLSARDAMQHPWIARSRPPSGQLIPNPVHDQERSEEADSFAEPSNRWSTAFDSLSLTTPQAGV